MHQKMETNTDFLGVKSVDEFATEDGGDVLMSREGGADGENVKSNVGTWDSLEAITISLTQYCIIAGARGFGFR